MDSFTVTLPSNVISDYNNRIGNFRTYLPKRINLKNEWEVGLSEISYPKTFWNVNGYNGIYLIKKIERTMENGTKTFYEINDISHIEEGFYDTPNDIIDKINKKFRERIELDNKSTFPYLTINEHTRKITLNSGYDNKDRCYTYPFFNGNLIYILGLLNEESKAPSKLLSYKLKDHIDKFPGQSFPGKRPIDLTSGIHSLMVYTNIIEPGYVGNSFTKLLRNVEIPPKSRFGDQLNIKYDKIHYKPLQNNDINMIEIDIKDDSGETVPFHFGRSIITLQFKKK